MSTIEGSKSASALKDLMQRSRTADMRQKLACIQWVRTLFSHHDAVVLDTLLSLADDSLPSIADAVNTEVEKLLVVITEESKQSYDGYAAVLKTLLRASVDNGWLFNSPVERGGVRGLAARYHWVKLVSDIVAVQLKATTSYDDRTAVMNSFNRYDPLKDLIVVRENRSMASIDEELFASLCIALQCVATSSALEIELKRSEFVVPSTDPHKAVLSESQLKMNSQLVKSLVLLTRNSLLLSGSPGAKNYCRTHGMLSSLVSLLVLPDLSMSLHIAQCVAALSFGDLNYNATTQRILTMKIGNLNIADNSFPVAEAVRVANTLQCLSAIIEVLIEPRLTEERVRRDVSAIYPLILEYVSKVLSVVDKLSPRTPLAYEINYLVLCCLRILSRLASRNLLVFQSIGSWLVEVNVEESFVKLAQIRDQVLSIVSDGLEGGLSAAVICASAESMSRLCISADHKGTTSSLYLTTLIFFFRFRNSIQGGRDIVWPFEWEARTRC